MYRKIVIDVGAGMWAQYGNYLTPFQNYTFIVFEPHPELNQKIHNIKNKIKLQNKNIDDTLLIYDNAISSKSEKNLNFYLLNDPVASSLCELNTDGALKWKYPFNRKIFSVLDTIKVNTLSLHDFISNHKFIKKQTIELLNIDIQGNCIDVLHGLSPTQFSKIKRIIIKCIDIDYELYKNQSNTLEIIDLLKTYDFTIIRGCMYSRNQEQILEFINTRFKPTQNDFHPLFKLTETGDFTINL